MRKNVGYGKATTTPTSILPRTTTAPTKTAATPSERSGKTKERPLRSWPAAQGSFVWVRPVACVVVVPLMQARPVTVGGVEVGEGIAKGDS